MPYKISNECIGCGLCASKCPENAINGQKNSIYNIDISLCLECGTCFKSCPNGAIINPQGNRSLKKRKKKLKKRASIDSELCACCKNCYLNCPKDAISIIKNGFFSIGFCKVSINQCIGCGTCTNYCITGAISLS